MALTQVYTAVSGHVITAARWNNEFGNIYANGSDIAFPLTKAVSLAGWTLTLDGAGATTLLSTASIGFSLSPGTKSGAPSVNGSFFTLVAATFTDTSTSASGTADFWAGTSFRTPTLAASNTNVTTTDAATVYIEGPPTEGTNQTLTESSALFVDGKLKVAGDIRLRSEDSRTNTVVAPLTVQVTTDGTPAAGIGVGISFHAESADESPSVVGRTDFAFSDVSAGSEDSYFDVLLRTAGAAASSAYRWVRTNAFKGIFTHANTADRTYTLPDFSCTLGPSGSVQSPVSFGSGSSVTHQGDVTISSHQNPYTGIKFFTNFVLNAGVTLTLGASGRRLIIVASESITINGTISANSAGEAGGASDSVGTAGMGQPGGGGGAGAAGGAVYTDSWVFQAGGAASTSGTQCTQLLQDWYVFLRGSGGGGGGATNIGPGGVGGAGAGHIILIAPQIILGAASVLQAVGVNGSIGGHDNAGGGGGGGGGNVYMRCATYTDNGCTFTLTGGTGANSVAGTDGGNGATGIRQIDIYT